MKLTRRDFIASLTGAAGGLALSRVPFRRLAGLADIPPYDSAPEVERWVRSSCLLCPGGCGIEVRVMDGSPIKIRGNSLHPINQRGLCAVGQEGLHILYHPDRIRSPKRRDGERGEGRWVTISWEKAIAEVAEKLGGIVAAGRPESILLLDGFGRGVMTRLLGRFAAALGSPNHILDTSPGGLSATMQLTQGVSQAPAYDLEHAGYILSFGAPLLEGWRSPLQGQRGYASIRRDRQRKLVQIDVRQSLTATRANRWVPARPGGYGALALSMAYVIVREDLYDHDFVGRHTFGFEDWKDETGATRRGFREHLLQKYRPDRMEEETGVPAAVVVEVAKEFAEHARGAGGAVAVADHSATMYSNGIQSTLAIQALNALVGAIDREGGVLVGEGVPFAEWPSLPEGLGGETPRGQRIDGVGDRFPFGSDCVAAIPQAVLGQGPGVEALLLHYSNPCFSTPEPERFIRALGKIPFVVSFTPLPDDTSRYADLILPDHTYLERWQDAVGPDSFGYSLLGSTQPAVEPLYDTRHTGDVILDVARKMGGAVAEAFPWSSFQDLLQESVKGVYEAQRGTVLAKEHVYDEVRQLEMGGWWLPRHKSFREFWADFVENGGWWDPAYVHKLWGRVLRTPSGKYEFGEQVLLRKVLELARGRGEGAGEEADRIAAVLESLGIRAGPDEAFLPHHEAPRFQGFEEAHSLNLFRPICPSSGFLPDLPWVREILNPRVAWDLWVEMNPEDAKSRGIEDGDWVALVSPVGRIRARALLGHEAQPGQVNVPYGLGRKSAGRWGLRRGANPNHLIPAPPEAIDPLSGVPLGMSTKVRIEPAGGGGDDNA